MERDIECDKNLLKFLGYKKGLKPIEFDTRLNKLADYLFNFIFTTKESFGLNNGSDLRKDARSFFNNYGEFKYKYKLKY